VDIAADTNEIQKIIGEYFENLYSSKLGNQQETDKYLNRRDPPKLNAEGTNNINRYVRSNEFETGTMKLSQQRKALAQMISLLNSTRL
jgi:hypothetical protein